MVDARLKAVTVLPLVLALTFMFFASAITFGAIARAYLSTVEAGIREAQEHSPKTRQNLVVYVYNVSLCKTMSLITKVLKNQTVNPEDTDLAGPVKILIFNQGGTDVELDHIAVSFLGTKVYESHLNVRLKPGEHVVYSPRDLNLPDKHDVLTRHLDGIVLHGGGETFRSLAYGPPPLTLVDIDSGGACSEP